MFIQQLAIYLSSTKNNYLITSITELNHSIVYFLGEFPNKNVWVFKFFNVYVNNKLCVFVCSGRLGHV
jgi:hypothetical protein